jgi:hypothetical protein
MIDLAQSATHDTHRSPHPVVRTGLSTGALLSLTALAALVAANRVPGLERYALERNAASYGIFAILMLVPVCRFFGRPVHMFGSAMIGWVLFVSVYDLSGMYFRNLFRLLRMPFEALCEGALIYGVIAVVSWVGGMILHLRHHSILPGRRGTYDSARHRP